MLDELLKYDYLVLPHIKEITRALLIPFVSLGIVYSFGRLLNLLKTDTSKNYLAFLSILGLTYLTGDFKHIDINFILNSISIAGISVIIYVTFCWKLYNRIENFLDKKIASGERPKKRKRKKK